MTLLRCIRALSIRYAIRSKIEEPAVQKLRQQINNSYIADIAINYASHL